MYTSTHIHLSAFTFIYIHVHSYRYVYIQIDTNRCMCIHMRTQTRRPLGRDFLPERAGVTLHRGRAYPRERCQAIRQSLLTPSGQAKPGLTVGASCVYALAPPKLNQPKPPSLMDRSMHFVRAGVHFADIVFLHACRAFNID